MTADAMELKRALADAGSASDWSWASLVLEPSTDVQAYPAPFLSRHRIVRLVVRSPYHPTGSFVAFAEGGPVHTLTDNPAAFTEMARADGVRVEDESMATTYAVAWMETTARAGELLRILHSVDQIEVWPEPSEKDRERIAQVRRAHGSVVKQPSAVRAGSSVIVLVHALRQRSLERHIVMVTVDGDVEDNTEVLEERLPVVFGA